MNPSASLRRNFLKKGDAALFAVAATKSCVPFFLLSIVAAATALGQQSADGDRKPFFTVREHLAEFSGPGREIPEPADFDEVLIGYFGPDDPTHAQGGDPWRAAQMAVEEANRDGGYRGKPFRLVAGWSENPWSTGVVHVARMVFDTRVWAIVGGIDGPSTHLAEQVAVKAHLSVLSPISTDKTVNLTNVPWMFSSLPGDHLQTPLLARAIAARGAMGDSRQSLVLVSATDHDSRRFVAELKKSLAEHHIAPQHHFEFRPATPDVTELTKRIVQSQADTAVLIAPAADSALVMNALAKQGFSAAVFGGPRMGRRQFVLAAGESAEGIVFPLLYDQTPAWSQFSKRFQQRYGHPPDYAAGGTYDTVRLVIGAIDKAGLNRARIRDAVRDLSPWPGVTGRVKWDLVGSNTRAARLGTIKNGRAVPVPSTRDPG